MTAAWDDLVRMALLGTERQPFATPQADPALEEILRQLPTAPSEPALLGASGAVWLYEHAGRRSKAPAEVKAAAGPDADELRPVRSPAADRLARILAGDHGDVLPEWLRACAAASKRVPYSLLPDVLDAGRSRREIRELVNGVISPRGRWLASQRSDWDFGAGAGTTAEDPSLFETGGPPVRLAFIERLRQTDPDRAREMVASVWDSEPPEMRQMFIGTFRRNLSMSDEPLLESALDDKRKEVRKVAAELLARLGESRFTQRMRDRLKPLLAFYPGPSGKGKKAKGAKIDVTLPEDADKPMVRDGIDAKPPGGMRIGQKAWWLTQMLAMVHPQHWSRAWNTFPEDLIANTDMGEWYNAILTGWAGATALHRDPRWSIALLTAWTESKINFDAPSNQRLVESLFAALPPDQAESIVTRLLDNPKHHQDERLVEILTSLTHEFSPAFSRVLLAFLRKLTNAQSGIAWHMRESMKQFALRIPPALANEAASGWNDKSKHWAWWQSAVDGLIETLQFRQAMLKEITHEQESCGGGDGGNEADSIGRREP